MYESEDKIDNPFMIRTDHRRQSDSLRKTCELFRKCALKKKTEHISFSRGKFNEHDTGLQRGSELSSPVEKGVEKGEEKLENIDTEVKSLERSVLPAGTKNAKSLKNNFFPAACTISLCPSCRHLECMMRREGDVMTVNYNQPCTSLLTTTAKEGNIPPRAVPSPETRVTEITLPEEAFRNKSPKKCDIILEKYKSDNPCKNVSDSAEPQSSCHQSENNKRQNSEATFPSKLTPCKLRMNKKRKTVNNLSSLKKRVSSFKPTTDISPNIRISVNNNKPTLQADLQKIPSALRQTSSTKLPSSSNSKTKVYFKDKYLKKSESSETPYCRSQANSSQLSKYSIGRQSSAAKQREIRTLRPSSSLKKFSSDVYRQSRSPSEYRRRQMTMSKADSPSYQGDFVTPIKKPTLSTSRSTMNRYTETSLQTSKTAVQSYGQNASLQQKARLLSETSTDCLKMNSGSSMNVMANAGSARNTVVVASVAAKSSATSSSRLQHDSLAGGSLKTVKKSDVSCLENQQRSTRHCENEFLRDSDIRYSGKSLCETKEGSQREFKRDSKTTGVSSNENIFKNCLDIDGQICEVSNAHELVLLKNYYEKKKRNQVWKNTLNEFFSNIFFIALVGITGSIVFFLTCLLQDVNHFFQLAVAFFIIFIVFIMVCKPFPRFP